MPAVRIPQERREWQSPVCVGVLESAGAVRAALEELGWSFERKRSTRFYSKFSVVMMMPKGAYVFQFIVKEGPALTFETWETDISAGARMTHLKVEGFTREQEGEVRRFLELYRKATGKDPWRFTRGERSRAGYLLPEFGRAKKAWAALGFDVKAKR